MFCMMLTIEFDKSTYLFSISNMCVVDWDGRFKAKLHYNLKRLVVETTRPRRLTMVFYFGQSRRGTR